jgi:serine/threonine protein kinase
MKDLALIKTHSRTGMAVLRGTLRWMPPELLEGDAIDYPADVYSFGITVWELYTLEVPFSDLPERAFFRCVIDKKQRPNLPSTMNDDLKDLVREWWDHDAHKRPKFKAISATLERLVSVSHILIL